MLDSRPCNDRHRIAPCQEGRSASRVDAYGEDGCWKSEMPQVELQSQRVDDRNDYAPPSASILSTLFDFLSVGRFVDHRRRRGLENAGDHYRSDFVHTSCCPYARESAIATPETRFRSIIRSDGFIILAIKMINLGCLNLRSMERWAFYSI